MALRTINENENAIVRFLAHNVSCGTSPHFTRLRQSWSGRSFPLLTERRSCVLLSVSKGSMSKPSDLVQGTLDVLLLKILALEPCTAGPSVNV